jgi:hypothetical protein
MDLSVYCSTAFVEPRPLFQFLNLLGLEVIPSQGRCLHTRHHEENKRTQTSTPQVGFETTILMFERAKTVHALDRAATMIGICGFTEAMYVGY